MRAFVIALSALVANGCIEANNVRCGSLLCPSSMTCVAEICTRPEQLTACETLSEDDECMALDARGVCHDGACRVPVCGNGRVEDGEACDDLNLDSGDGCSARCDSMEICGNGVRDFVTGEECDDGNSIDADTCRTTCVVPRCGDGVIDAHNGEACDDGAANSIAPSATCRPNCQPGRCGDGVVDSTEVCDDTNLVSGDGCSGDCRSVEVCGNEIIDTVAGEQCDRGAALSGDGCTSRCTAEFDTWRRGEVVVRGGGRDALAFHHATGRTILLTTETWEWDGENWRRARPLTEPPRRDSAAIAYDRARGRTVMFGGFDGALRGDTWEWDGRDWHALSPANPPSPRRVAGMAWDSVGQRIILFGGVDASGNRNDTWAWDGTTWTPLTPADSPSARWVARSIDTDLARQRIVLVGGVGNSGPIADTWEWTGTNWEDVSAGGGPSATYNSGVGDDAGNGVLVHVTPTSGVTEVWQWSGAAWTLLSSGAASCLLPALVFDDVRGVSVMTCDPAFQSTELLTWERSGGVWNLRPNRATPPVRSSGRMATDLARGRIVMFGGDQGIITTLDDTWEYDGAWTKRPTLPAQTPQARGGHALVYDIARREVVMFGGIAFCFGDCANGFTEVWDGTRWYVRTPAMQPERRYNHFMVYDVARAETVLFGGYHLAFLDDTWTWNGSNWTPKSATGPLGADARAMAYDMVRQRVVLLTRTSTWEWNGTSWTDVQPSSHPGDRVGSIMVYNPLRQRIVMAGNGADGLDTWEWDGSQWTEQLPIEQPAPRSAAGAAYDPTSGRILMFGGDLGTIQVTDETWLYGFGSTSVPADTCATNVDADGDGAAGCADPDCWNRCTPFCMPGATCDPSLPWCGDGTCSAVEDDLICPGDC